MRVQKKCKMEDLSPYTGWTIRHWWEAALRLLSNIYPHYSPGRALVQLHGIRPSIYGALSDGVEGFARMFLLVGFWLHHRRDGLYALEDGTQVDWVDLYRQGMLNGTDPEHPEYWGEISGKHQYMVEAASMAVGLHFSRHLIWEGFSTQERQQIGDWLRHILRYPFEDKNWVLFGVLINTFLKSVDQEYHQEQIDFYLDRFDSYYEAEGWYRDGVGPQFDHYNPWALHFYPHLWAQMDPAPRRPELIKIFRDRSRLFLEKFPYYFSSTASHPAFGRSSIYRCALVSAVTMGAWQDFSPLSPGLSRRLCSQSLKYFWEHDLFNADGAVTLGWNSQFLLMAEKYSGPGSPLWMNKAFSAFLLPEDHPFWTATEEPLPIEEGDTCVHHRVPGFLVQGHRDTGHVQLINQGSDSYVNATTDWKTPASDFQYIKFAYSSHFFNDLGPTRTGLVCGNMISLFEEKRGYSHRERCYPVHISDRVAIAYHFPFGEQHNQKRDSRIETAIIMKGDHQLRVHWVISPNRPLVFEGGYPVAYDDEQPMVDEGEDWIGIRTNDYQSCIRALLTYDQTGTDVTEGVNPLGKFTRLPYVRTSQPVLAHAILASEIIARPGHFDYQEELALVASYAVEGRRVTFTFNDGEGVTVKLGAVEEEESKMLWFRV
ncbi:MAG: DUF2264 domain-containing protein [Fidelibacterota bacterium]|nr:MAG: DUF2264 domain-containing protein [Candidatus Neomarinimicrobiota bacterium]